MNAIITTAAEAAAATSTTAAASNWTALSPSPPPPPPPPSHLFLPRLLRPLLPHLLQLLLPVAAAADTNIASSHGRDCKCCRVVIGFIVAMPVFMRAVTTCVVIYSDCCIPGCRGCCWVSLSHVLAEAGGFRLRHLLIIRPRLLEFGSDSLHPPGVVVSRP